MAQYFTPGLGPDVLFYSGGDPGEYAVPGEGFVDSPSTVETGTITTSLGGISQVGDLVVQDTGTIITRLGGISQHLVGHTVRGPGLGRRNAWTS